MGIKEIVEREWYWIQLTYPLIIIGGFKEVE